MPNLKLEMGQGQEIVANTDAITLRQVKELAEEVAEIHRKHSILKNNPQKDNESFEEYQARVRAERSRKSGESMDDYLKRIYPVDLESQTQILDALKAINKVLNKGREISEDAFWDSTSYVAAKNFVKDVLVSCDLA